MNLCGPAADTVIKSSGYITSELKISAICGAELRIFFTSTVRHRRTSVFTKNTVLCKAVFWLYVN